MGSKEELNVMELVFAIAKFLNFGFLSSQVYAEHCLHAHRANGLIDMLKDALDSYTGDGDNEWHEVTRKKSNSVFQRLRFPSSVSNRYPSKEDQTQKISKSVFVTNFPDHFSARDLWNVCVAYGKVVDVFIPFKRSKAGKKFAFVRFIRVDNMERLLGNLTTIWIGKFRLHANVVRFHRDPKSTDSQSKINVPHPNKSFVAPVKNMGTENRSFASVLNVGNGISNKAT
ncbi:RNA-directed DNA polymerase, eukaryota [Tanacetum coccineum]